ncbi:hypothetical protein CRG98_011783, partial [Punica granatum]
MTQLQAGKPEPPSPSSAGLKVGHYSTTSRIGKLEFPRFGGDGVREWLYRCEQFFDVDETPDDIKLKLVVIHLEGRALQWHQSFMRFLGVDGKMVTWGEYVAALVSRFGEMGNDDPMADLKNLKQTGGVQDYLNEFDALLNKVTISEVDTLSHFLGGLKTEIQLSIRMFHPTTLNQTYSLAKLQESTYTALHKPVSSTPKLHNILSSNNYTPHQNVQPNTPKSHPTITHKNTQTTHHKGMGNGLLPLPTQIPQRNTTPLHTRPHKTLTQKEMDERRANNLCFWCEERFVPGHRCSRRRAFLIEVEAVEEELEGREEEELFHILVDSGSRHNFLNEEAGKKLGCHTELMPTMKVSVTNENELKCERVCKKFQWRMQGREYEADMLLFPLESYDIVLGMQWLSTLGDILWNFKDLQMKFAVGGKESMLQGNNSEELKTITKEQMEKLLHKKDQLIKAQLCTLELSCTSK